MIQTESKTDRITKVTRKYRSTPFIINQNALSGISRHKAWVGAISISDLVVDDSNNCHDGCYVWINNFTKSEALIRPNLNRTWMHTFIYLIRYYIKWSKQSRWRFKSPSVTPYESSLGNSTRWCIRLGGSRNNSWVLQGRQRQSGYLTLWLRGRQNHPTYK